MGPVLECTPANVGVGADDEGLGAVGEVVVGVEGLGAVGEVVVGVVADEAALAAPLDSE